MKLIDIIIPLSNSSKLTEEYSYNHYGDYAVIDGSTTSDYRLKIDTYDYDGTCVCVTTAGVYAGNVSLYSGKFSVGNNVKCYFVKEKYRNIDLNYLSVHMLSIAEKCLTGKTGDYASLNISMFENFEFNLPSIEIQKKCSEFYKKYELVNKKIKFIQQIISDQDYNMNIINYEYISEIQANKIFKLDGGCSKLTEEFRYNNSDNDLLPVYTGAKKFENLFVNKQSVSEKYQFYNYDMKVTRKGDAGFVMLVDDDIFTINDDAYAIKNIPNEHLINNKYIYLWIFRKHANNAVVDEDGNGTFSKTNFEREIIKIPNKEIQKTLIGYMYIYEALSKLIFEANNELNI